MIAIRKMFRRIGQRLSDSVDLAIWKYLGMALLVSLLSMLRANSLISAAILNEVHYDLLQTLLGDAPWNEDVVNSYPDVLTAFEQGVLLMRLGSPERAIELLEMADADGEQMAAFLLGDIYFRANNPERAAAKWRKLESNVTRRLSFQLSIDAERARNRHEWDNVIRLAELAIELESKQPIAWRHLAFAYGYVGYGDRAERAFQTALAMSTDARLSASILQDWGTLLELQGSGESAIGKYEQALEYDAHALRVRLQLARLHQSLGNSDAAKEYYRSILAIESDNLSAMLGLGDLAFSIGDWEAARSWYEKAESVDKSGNSSLALGRLSMKEGDLDSAINWLELAQQQLGVAHWMVRVELGRAYTSANQWEKAQTAYLSALEIVGMDASSKWIWVEYAESVANISQNEAAEIWEILEQLGTSSTRAPETIEP